MTIKITPWTTRRPSVQPEMLASSPASCIRRALPLVPTWEAFKTFMRYGQSLQRWGQAEMVLCLHGELPHRCKDGLAHESLERSHVGTSGNALRIQLAGEDASISGCTDGSPG